MAFFKDQGLPLQSWGLRRAGLEGAPGSLGGCPGVNVNAVTEKGRGEPTRGFYVSYISYCLLTQQAAASTRSNAARALMML